MNPLREDEVKLLALTDARNGMRLQMTGIHAAECVAQVVRVGVPPDLGICATGGQSAPAGAQ